jgi:hypothetical protein
MAAPPPKKLHLETLHHAPPPAPRVLKMRTLGPARSGTAAVPPIGPDGQPIAGAPADASGGGGGGSSGGGSSGGGSSGGGGGNGGGGDAAEGDGDSGGSADGGAWDEGPEQEDAAQEGLPDEGGDVGADAAAGSGGSGGNVVLSPREQDALFLGGGSVVMALVASEVIGLGLLMSGVVGFGVPFALWMIWRRTLAVHPTT